MVTVSKDTPTKIIAMSSCPIWQSPFSSLFRFSFFGILYSAFYIGIRKVGVQLPSDISTSTRIVRRGNIPSSLIPCQRNHKKEFNSQYINCIIFYFYLYSPINFVSQYQSSFSHFLLNIKPRVNIFPSVLGILNIDIFIIYNQ